MATTLLAIGTRKGLWLATSEDRRSWSLSSPHFLMTEVPSVGIDVRGGRTRLMVGVRSEHFGPTVVHSDDLGVTWDEPAHGAIRFPADTGAAVERISVWRSEDGGDSFALCRTLWDHPHRPEWGAGYGGAAAHSVVPGPGSTV